MAANCELPKKPKEAYHPLLFLPIRLVIHWVWLGTEHKTAVHCAAIVVPERGIGISGIPIFIFGFLRPVLNSHWPSTPVVAYGLR